MKIYATALSAACEQVRLNLSWYGAQFPLPCTQNGVYPLGINTDWTTGFAAGMNWLAWQSTGDGAFRQAAEAQVDSFARRLALNENLDHHDMGFLYIPSCVAAYRLTGSDTGRSAALAAARRLAQRFRPKGQFLQAWGRLDDTGEYRLIIDCLLNVPLLAWAAQQTGEESLSRMAAAHTATAARTLFRPDGSTAHTCTMDPATGEPLQVMTAQGYAPDSAWARGQAWGIYGMALAAAREPQNTLYRQLFAQTADFFLERLPADGIPYWDLVFRDGEQPRDSSAAAIAVCGLYEMLPLLDGEQKARYAQAADRLLSALIDRCTQPPRPGAGLLTHGVYCKSSPYNTVKDYGVDECNLWGDYFYMEALVRRTRRWDAYWQCK